MADPKATTAPVHLPALDGVRGLAAMAVLFSHASNAGLAPSWFGGSGEIGVMVFYMLSGFLMSYLYLDRPFGRTELHTYAVSRGARVLPLYYAVVVGALLLLIVLGNPLYKIFGPGDAFATLFLLEGSGIFWSIPVEIHFYIVFVLLWWARSKGLFALCLAGLLALQACALWAFDQNGIEGRWLTSWLHIFALGGLLAMGRHRIGGRNLPPAAHALGWAALIGLIFVAPALRHALGIPVDHAMRDPFTIGVTVAVLVAASLNLGPMRYFAVGWARWLGRMSFGIYLLHILFIGIAVKLAPIIPLPGFGLAFVIVGTLLAAWFANILLERPSAIWLRGRLAPRGGLVASGGGIEGGLVPPPK